MKRILCAICVVSFGFSVVAQVPSLCISSNKTTSLIFPLSVKHVDRGSKDILVQQVKEAENILLVKAATAGFAETNLSVITEDGSLYTFSVCFDDHPLMWVYQLPIQKEASIAAYANGVLDNPATMGGVCNKKWGVKAAVKGLYVKSGVFFCQLEIANNSNIDCALDYLRFYIRDQKKLKRTAVQEIELPVLYTAGNASLVKAKSSSVVVVAIDKFILPDRKYFAVEIGEKNGGRSLSLRMGNRHILKAIPLPDLH